MRNEEVLFSYKTMEKKEEKNETNWEYNNFCVCFSVRVYVL